METLRITPPLSDKEARRLTAGQQVGITGVIYTARDAAHKRLVDLLKEGGELPVNLNGQLIYFTGPTPARPGMALGSAGPTTSYRMDAYSPLLIQKSGLKGMIGKGNRGDKVVDAMKKHGAVYFAAIGGAGALIAKCIRSAKVVAYPELGPEAIHRLEVENFPVIVAIDSKGNNLYIDGPAQYHDAGIGMT